MPRPRPEWLTVPNLFTMLRLVLVPVFVVLHLTGRPGLALAVFAGAAISDALDGFLARVLNQRSRLGALLDPIADKLLVFSALTTLVIEGRLPGWLLALVVLRDAFMGLGFARARLKNIEVETKPTRIGKYATFSLALLVVLALVDHTARDTPLLHAYTVVVAFVSALCVVISTGQYLNRYGYVFVAKGGRSSHPASEGQARGSRPEELRPERREPEREPE